MNLDFELQLFQFTCLVHVRNELFCKVHSLPFVFYFSYFTVVLCPVVHLIGKSNIKNLTMSYVYILLLL